MTPIKRKPKRRESFKDTSPGGFPTDVLRKNTRDLALPNSAIFDSLCQILIKLARSLDLPILVLDSNYIIRSANQSFFSTYYKLSPTIINQPAENILYKQRGKKQISEILKKLKRRKFRGYFDTMRDFLTLDGRLIAIHITMIQINGELYYFVIASDITNTKGLAHERNRLFSLISHELKTPLAAIKGFSQLMIDHLKKGKTDQFEIFLNKIQNNIDSLVQLTDEIFDMSQIETGKFKIKKSVCLIDHLVAEIVEEIRFAEPNREIVLCGNINRPIKIDRNRIRQALINLINNAIRYSPKEKHIIVSLKNDGARAYISIQDFGEGIPAKHIPNIFDRFCQCAKHRKAKGLGLGLHIAREVINEHGGEIDVKSRPGEGSTFTISLSLND